MISGFGYMDQNHMRSHHKESMKLALLSHEKIFRQQVYELHRLYRVQKLLMSNMETAIKRSTVEQQVMDESEIQLTLGPSIKSCSINGGVDHHDQKRLISGQSLTPSTNSKVSSKIRSKDGATSDRFEWNFDDSGENGMQMNLGEERLVKHPPWLFQTLSLSLT